jgi:hypothetical protein
MADSNTFSMRIVNLEGTHYWEIPVGSLGEPIPIVEAPPSEREHMERLVNMNIDMAHETTTQVGVLVFGTFYVNTAVFKPTT